MLIVIGGIVSEGEKGLHNHQVVGSPDHIIKPKYSLKVRIFVTSCLTVSF
jgi:hypothetical protein